MFPLYMFGSKEGKGKKDIYIFFIYYASNQEIKINVCVISHIASLPQP